MKKGSKHTEETKKKMSELKKGGKHPNFGHEGYWKGKKRGPLSEEQKRKLSEAKKDKNNPNWKGGEVKIKCKVCGKERYVAKIVIKQGMGKFCSHKCHAKGKNNPKWRGGNVKRICLNCNKEFEITRSRFNQGEGKFCSQKCFGIWVIKHMKKKDTSIEIAIEKELIRRNIPYTKQVPLLGITLVDFLLPKDTVIYCDGDYWHSKTKVKTRDMNQDFILKFYGYKVFRFKETEIKESVKKCINQIKGK